MVFKNLLSTNPILSRTFVDKRWLSFYLETKVFIIHFRNVIIEIIL